MDIARRKNFPEMVKHNANILATAEQLHTS